MSEEKKIDENETEVTSESELAQETNIPDSSDGWALCERIAWHILEKKGEDVMVMDLRGRSDVCDFFVVASGKSTIQTKAIAKSVQDGVFDYGQKPKNIEGLDEGRWVLVDFFDVIVHIFNAEARGYFMLERLWGDVGKVDLDFPYFTNTEVRERHAGLDFNIAPEGS
jgi:ribosome-associated protein